MPVKLKTTQDVESLLAFAETVTGLGERMNALAQSLKDHGFESVDCTHFATAAKALTFLANFNAGIQDAIIEARKDRGDFEAKVSEPKRKPGRKRS